MLDSIKMTIGDTFNVIMSDNDRIIALFLVPLFIAAFATVSPYAVYYASATNPNYVNTLTSIKLSGVCQTISPYFLISFNGSGLCQIISFNPFVFVAWYLEGLAIVLIVIFIIVNIFHIS